MSTFFVKSLVFPQPVSKGVVRGNVKYGWTPEVPPQNPELCITICLVNTDHVHYLEKPSIWSGI